MNITEAFDWYGSNTDVLFENTARFILFPEFYRQSGIMQDLKRRGYRGTYFLQSFAYTEQTLGKVKPEKRLFEENELKDTLNVVWRKM